MWKKKLQNVWYVTYAFFVTRPTPKKKVTRLKLFDVPEAYPKGAEGRLVNDKRFIRELEELLV